ncbi:MAG TPA: phosphoenolpyruvate synthase, partial [Thermodesulfovibrionia bacterium]|nr:phosphoenolpyruvate synthase [Thermodesulfovibrionia bacterium]
ASVAREFHVPAIFDTEMATSVIQDGQDITVDAINCNIYNGLVQELAQFSGKHDDPFRSTQLFRTLEEVVKKVSPLNLLNPSEPDFKPESCKTLHDITRFCHEMSMRHMFAITNTSFREIGGAIQLFAGIPTQVYVINLGDGLAEGYGNKLKPDQITSVPFNALLKGLVSMKWPEPRAFDAKGFLGMVAHTAAMQENELMEMGQQSFAFISALYMNFSIRLGYHLSTIEAYADENFNSNYIRFFFKGGGAATDRRLRRVRLIVEVLKKIDFEVKIKDDVIEAVVSRYKKAEIEKTLEIMGRLTVYTKQLDMVMYSDEVTNWYVQEFLNDHVKLD